MPDYSTRLPLGSLDQLVKFIKLQSQSLPATEREILVEANGGSAAPKRTPNADAQAAQYAAAQRAWQPAQASLWSQLGARALAGPQAGATLTPLPCELTHWGSWFARHPQTTLLSTDTGSDRDYTQNAYGAYYDRAKLRFPVAPALPSDSAVAPFERGLAIETGTSWHAWDYRTLGASSRLADLPAEAAAAQDPAGKPDPARAPRAVELGGEAFIYEPEQAGMEPATVRLALADERPRVYGLWWALYAFGYAK
jgi:hypothetical protein